MKRIILFLACLIGMATTLSAQRAYSTGKTTKKQREKKALTWGIRAGMNYANVLNAPDGSGRIGFNVGGNLDVGFCSWFHMQTGLYLSQKGVTAEYNNWCYVTGEGMNTEQQIGRTRGSFAPLYIEVPVLASFHIAFSDNSDIQFGVGPYVAYGIGDEMYSFQRYGTMIHLGSQNEYKNLEGFDAGVQANIGISLKHIYLGIGYQIGLFTAQFWRVSPSGGFTQHVVRSSNMMVNVGYNF